MNLSQCHADHRKRMRERFLKNGISVFEDHELLEMVMYYSITRRNTNDIAHQLLDRFGSLTGVLTADRAELCEIENVGESTSVFLNMYADTCNVLISEVLGKIVFDTDDRVGIYALLKIGMSPKGSAFVAYTDKRGMLKSEEWLYIGKNRLADAPESDIVSRAEKLCAGSVILVHDHRGEVLETSPEDVVFTDTLRSIAESKEIKLWHVIVSDNGYIFI